MVQSFQDPGLHAKRGLSMKDVVEHLRQKVDSIDQSILVLLQERFAVTAKIMQIKQEFGWPVIDAQRERAILEWVGHAAGTPEEQNAYLQIFRKIIDVGRKRFEKAPLHLEWHDELTESEVLYLHKYQMRNMSLGPIVLSADKKEQTDES